MINKKYILLFTHCSMSCVKPKVIIDFNLRTILNSHHVVVLVPTPLTSVPQR